LVARDIDALVAHSKNKLLEVAVRPVAPCGAIRRIRSIRLIRLGTPFWMPDRLQAKAVREKL